MDFSTQLDDLQQRAADAKTSAQAAVSESRDQLRQRIDQAKVDMDLAANARQQVDEAAASARGRWAKMKADAAAKLDDFDARMDRRADQLDAKVAANQADGAEADAADAIDFAAWTVDNARLAVLDAIDARVYADELATTVGS
jgi:chromosome segregation ATPase